jgi:hypothetical protein
LDGIQKILNSWDIWTFNNGMVCHPNQSTFNRREYV